MTEINDENNEGKHELLMGVVRKVEGKPPVLVLRWDAEKMLSRLCAKTSENYFRKGLIKRPRALDKFLNNLKDAWADLSRELEDETRNTPNI